MSELAVRKSCRSLLRPQSGRFAAAQRISSILRERVRIEMRTRLTGDALEKITQLEAEVTGTPCNRSLRAHFSNFNNQKDLTVLTLRGRRGLIGYIAGWRSEAADSFMIDLLGIAPSCQFKGIARHLLGHYFELIKSKGYKTACLSCKKKSVSGVDLPRYYSSLGFKPTRVSDLFEKTL